ncbi:hypothetical protein AB0I28_31950 [Phytomonospora sp. NPDC050363]|uniref:hypothetical protein n=1 Tax=Phytomonospora sp. NPDC050363 TaxID=3155642 RepID=UPI0033EB7E47
MSPSPLSTTTPQPRLRTPGGADPLEVLRRIHLVLNDPYDPHWNSDHFQLIGELLVGAGYRLADADEPAQCVLNSEAAVAGRAVLAAVDRVEPILRAGEEPSEIDLALRQLVTSLLGYVRARHVVAYAKGTDAAHRAFLTPWGADAFAGYLTSRDPATTVVRGLEPLDAAPGLRSTTGDVLTVDEAMAQVTGVCHYVDELLDGDLQALLIEEAVSAVIEVELPGPAHTGAATALRRLIRLGVERFTVEITREIEEAKAGLVVFACPGCGALPAPQAPLLRRNARCGGCEAPF